MLKLVFVIAASAQDELPMGRLDKCEGVEKQLSACNVKECPEEVRRDCTWDSWGEWGSCECTGLMERQRTISRTSNAYGRPCEGSRSETKSCEPSCRPPDKDCVFGPWKEWDSCTKECGNGQRFRVRDIKSLLKADGTPCEGNTRETEACNTHSCDISTDCELSPWRELGNCSATCSGGQKTLVRKVKTEATYDGKLCRGNLTKVEACNIQPCADVVDCAWDEWQEWGACSRSCGGGEKTRARLIKTAPRDGGRLCKALDMGEVAPCNTQSCHDKQDCELGKWTEWDACSVECNGVQRRTRYVQKISTAGGKPCDSPLEEIQGCNRDCEAKVMAVKKDCKMGEWSDWMDCIVTCGSGEQSRSRNIVQRAEFGGKACNDELTIVRECNLKPCEEKAEVKVDCGVADWSSWSGCSATCAGGTRERRRNVDAMPSKHGKSCTHLALRESESCNTKSCHCVDCKWAAWSDWGACMCTGLKERHRGIEQHYENCGKVCEGVKTESAACEPKCTRKVTNCDLSEWSEWTHCSSSCGGGQTYRLRDVRVVPKNGGHLCTDNLRETKPCNLKDCVEREDCLLSQWADWDECSVSCGGGQKSRSRVLESDATETGKGCLDSLSETRGCNTEPCVHETDCRWQEWGEWSTCSSTCGGGQRSRGRSIEIAPRNGGKLCDPLSTEEESPCNTHPCGEVCIDGQLSEWSEWSYCSASCDVGFKTRHRRIEHEPNHCGRPIGRKHRSFSNSRPACANHALLLASIASLGSGRILDRVRVPQME